MYIVTWEYPSLNLDPSTGEPSLLQGFHMFDTVGPARIFKRDAFKSDDIYGDYTVRLFKCGEVK
jgi:hypothetical protein